MKQIKPGDVVAFKLNDKYYYAIILTKIIRFGGNLVYAFPFETENPITLQELLSLPTRGFNVIVDFIFAKREDRMITLGHIKDYSKFKLQTFFKACHETNIKSNNWFIYGENFVIIKRTPKLTKEEEKYPFSDRIDDMILAKYIKDKWLPELDIRV